MYSGDLDPTETVPAFQVREYVHACHRIQLSHLLTPAPLPRRYQFLRRLEDKFYCALKSSDVLPEPLAAVRRICVMLAGVHDALVLGTVGKILTSLM